jgi:hypothetical protein
MNQNLPNSFRSGPDERGHFGIFGGRFVAETLMPLILDLEKAYADAKADPAFQAEMDGYLKDYVGRPSPLYLAGRLTEHLGGAKIYFKREASPPRRCARGSGSTAWSIWARSMSSGSSPMSSEWKCWAPGWSRCNPARAH